MIVIKHLSGPLRGEEQSISDGRERITFGRSSSCDVVFPPEEMIVGRKHFALVRKPSGDWSIDLFGDHYVEVDGVEAQPGQPVPQDSKIRLGTKKGPSFQVISDPGAAAMQTGAATLPQKERVPIPVRFHRLARAGIAAFLVLLVAGLGWAYYDQQEKKEAASQLSTRLSALTQGQAKIEEEQEKIASERIRVEDQQRLVRAAFLVAQQDKQGRLSGKGTAWPIGPSLLATNAHIAELRAKFLERGDKLFVRAPGINGELFEVTEVNVHPDWNGFSDYVEERDVAVEAAGQTLPTRLLASGYDVALLHIDGEVPPSAILEIAPTKELEALAPGTPLAAAGYPIEYVVGSEMLPTGATPQLHFGVIGALTDYFFLPTNDVDQKLLIHHTIPITGGSSGSAIIGPNGRVVGIVSGMSNLPGGLFGPSRIPSAALVNFGERADLVTELTEAGAETVAAGDKAYWDKQIGKFGRGTDIVIPAALELIKPPQPGAALELISEKKGLLREEDLQTFETDDGEETWRIKSHEVNLHAGESMVILVYPEAYGAHLFYQVKDGTTKAHSTEQVRCPTISYTADTDETGFIVVRGDPELDMPYILQIYRWKIPEV